MMNRRKQPKEKQTKPKLTRLPIEPSKISSKRQNAASATVVRPTARGYVEVVGAGSAKVGGRFVRVKINGKKLLIPVNDLLGGMLPVYARLQNHGAALIEPKDQKDLHTRIKAALQKEDVFPVATRMGWFREEDAQGKKGPPVFVLPHGAIPENWSPVEVHLDEPDNDCYQRLQTKGTLEGAMQWLKLCDGNSRAMLGLSLACLGPVGSYLGLEHVGISLVSGAGKLKTVLASVIGSFYGGDDDPLNDLASGASMAQTDFNAEKVAAGRSGLVLILDEADNIEGLDAKAKADALFNLIKKVAQRRSKGRGTDPRIHLFYAPLVITTNESVASYTRKRGRHGDLSYIDRLLDLFPAEMLGYFFENLHGSADATAFRERIIPLIRANYGVPGWEFIRRLAKWIKKDEAGFRAFVQARIVAYRKLARKIPTPGRERERLHNKFAFVYAAGCVGIALGILPFKRDALLDAILRCERDHVAYVAKELGLGEGPAEINGDPFRAQIQKLGSYLRRSHPKMVNVRKAGARVPRGHDHVGCIGYLGVRDDRNEMWLPFPTFKRVVGGGRSDVRAVQDELLRRGLLRAEESAGGNREFSVKRDIPGIGRKRVVALLYKKRQATGQK